MKHYKTWQIKLLFHLTMPVCFKKQIKTCKKCAISKSNIFAKHGLDTSLPGGEMTLAIGKSGGAENSQVEVPITLREQIIGQIRLERNEDFSTDDQIWLEAIATQTALALENARLYNEAQNRAAREQIIGDISASISTFSDVDGILRAAVQQLGRRLGGAEVVLELGNQAEERRSGNELV